MQKIGKTINNRYRIEVEIGHGGMGTVYAGRDTLLNRDVAIKVLSRPEIGLNARERLLNEARAAAGLNHPNIVSIYDAGEADGVPFIVMEHVPGKPLSEARPDTIEEVINITRQICAALQHAHQHDIIHRDLKPENVLLTPDGTVKLSDFGLARSVTSRMTTEGLIGTLFYLAPELALGQDFDGRADLYALGVMLYEMTTGGLPFSADDPLAVISQHIHAPVVPPRARNETIPPTLDDLILKLLSKDPADRPGSAGQVLQTLDSAQLFDRTTSPAQQLSVLDRIARGRLVGRQRELEQAIALWQQAVDGTGQLLMISGDPGIGKTRLQQEIATHVEVTGGQVLVGECHEGAYTPYSSFAQVVRRALRVPGHNGYDIPNQVLADLLLIAPELHPDYPDVQPNPRLEPEAEQRRLLENMIRFCTMLSRHTPLLLVIEDLHWSDSGSLYLWRNLARRVRELPVMLLGTYREVELDEALPFHQALLDLNRQHLGTRLKLQRLDRDQTRQLLSIIFAEEITTDFLKGIYKETEGNPFFIEELCKTLVESGELYYTDGQWHRPTMAEMTIPQGVKVTIQSRVKRLTPETQDLLLNAAIIGREFDYPTLKLVTELEEESLIDNLEEALRAQLIEELKEGAGERFTFSHAMVPAVLRESVSGLRRNRMYRKVAQAVESLYPQDYERLAAHWGEAGDEERTLAYTIKAANRARQLYANQDAVRLYTEALDVLGEDTIERFVLLEGRAKVYDLLADREAQLNDINAMLALAEAHEDQNKRVDALLAQAQFYSNTNTGKAIQPAEQALNLARELGDIGREGLSLHLLGEIARSLYNFSQAQEYEKLAVNCLQTAGLTVEMAESISDLSNLYGMSGNDTAQLELALQAVQLGQSSGDPLIQATSTRRLAITYIDQNKYNQALPIAEEALRMFRQLGDISGEIHAINVLSIIQTHLGMTRQAEMGFLEIISTAETIDLDVGIRYVVNNIGELYNLSGEYLKPLLLIEQLLGKAHLRENAFLFQTLQVYKSMCLCGLGKFDLASQILEQHFNDPESFLNETTHAFGLSILGLAKAELKDFQQAEHYLQTAGEFCRKSDEIIIKVAFLIRSALAAVRNGGLSILQSGLEQSQQAVELLRPITSQRDTLGAALFAQASLHMALLSEDPSHAEHALTCTTEMLQIPYINPWMVFPERYFFLHSCVLRAMRREAEADDYLSQAYDRMMMAAGKIIDEDLRQSYLNNVFDNRQLAEEYHARGFMETSGRNMSME